MKIPKDFRTKFFDALSCDSSGEFAQYLRAYEKLEIPDEKFEISCEVVDGLRLDRMRLSIEGLGRQDVLKWFAACRRKIPLIEDLLYTNTTEKCFGIGLADYPSGKGVGRIKIYNFYGRQQLQAQKVEHIAKSFTLLNIPQAAFKKDQSLFKRIEFSGIDWDHEGQATIKVYFGLFNLEELFEKFSGEFARGEMLKYDLLRQKGLLSEKFLICVKYSPKGRSLRADMRYQTRKFVTLLKIFDPRQNVARFIADFYQIFHDLKLEYLSMQWNPKQKMQFYFNFNARRSQRSAS